MHVHQISDHTSSLTIVAIETINISGDSGLGLSIICSKIYLLFLPELLTYYSYFIPKYHQLFLFLFYCVNDIIKIQDWLYIIYIVTDCFNTIFDCTIRVCRSFEKLVGKAQQAFGRAWALPGMPFCYATV